jgi:hypothetical protein
MKPRRRVVLAILVVIGTVLAGAVPVMHASTASSSPSGATVGGFLHPGILLKKAQLDFVKAKLAVGAQPWQSALDQVRASKYSADSYLPHPVPEIQCGPGSPSIGCTALLDDATAAYTQALLWSYTGQPKYAAKSVEIMNAWANTQKSQSFSDGPLFSAWAAEMFPRAAEIIRYSYPSWSASDIQRFSNLLTTVYQPAIAPGSPWSNSNWELAMADGLINIGVFTDNRDTFDAGVAMWRARVLAYIYLRTDGPTPQYPPGGKFSTPVRLNCLWLWTSGPAFNRCVAATPAIPMTTFYNGQTQEFCRDFTHVGMSYAALIDAAETARIQGVNLYREQDVRIMTGLRFAASMLNGSPIPVSLCKGSEAPEGAKLVLDKMPTWEIAYDEYVTRAAQSLPELQTLTDGIRPTGTFRQMAWETLTTFGTGKAG